MKAKSEMLAISCWFGTAGCGFFLGVAFGADKLAIVSFFGSRLFFSEDVFLVRSFVSSLACLYLYYMTVLDLVLASLAG